MAKPDPLAPKLFFVLAGIYGAAAVALGAFAAHGMAADHAPEAVGWVDTGSRYQMVHAVALAVVAAAFDRAGRGRTRLALAAAGWTFALGGLLFPGALYALAFTGIGAFGAAAPVGGMALILGWLALAWAGVGWRVGAPQETGFAAASPLAGDAGSGASRRGAQNRS